MKLKRRLRRTGFHLLRLFAQAVGRGGMKKLRTVGQACGDWHYRLTPRTRRALKRQMDHALRDHPQIAQAGEWLREAYRINDRAVLELLAMYSHCISLDDISAACKISDADHLDQALARGRGVVMLGMHMGNGVAMAVHLARLGYPMAVIYREAGKIEPGFFRDGIESLGLEAIPAVPAAVGFRRMLKALKDNRILFILMDQAMSEGGVTAQFLGKQMSMPPGPAELARRTGAAVVPALLEGVDPCWEFRMGQPVWLDAEGPLEADVRNLTGIMQKHIEKRPQWWTWHQRRWSRYAFSDIAE